MAGEFSMEVEGRATVPLRVAAPVAVPRGSRGAFRGLDVRTLAAKVLRRLWSTHRAVAVVREVEADPAGLTEEMVVEFVHPDAFDVLPQLVEAATGVEYLYVRPIERARQARAGVLSVARNPAGEVMAFHFVHATHDHEALDQVAPGMYPQMGPDEVLTEAVYCLPAFRGRRIAPQLLRVTGARLAARGTQRAWAYLDTTNHAALRMFSWAGYAPSGVERVDRYRLGRFSTVFRDLAPKTKAEWDTLTAGAGSTSE